jgi:hypothetical protein
MKLSPEQRRPIFNAAKKLGVKFDVQSKVDILDAGINESLALIRADAPTLVVTTPLPASPLDGLSWPDMFTLITNPRAPALTDDDYERAAAALGNGVTPKHMKASKKVEAPRGAFDEHGHPSILYERHVFSRNTNPKGRFNATHPELSALKGYGPGGYGAFGAQYGKLASAYILDPEAAFEACSWGAFQVLGENATALGYESARAMAVELAKSEAAHLDSYVRFIKVNGLADDLGRCTAGDPDSCIPFVRGYNGDGFARFSYHIKFADALR